MKKHIKELLKYKALYFDLLAESYTTEGVTDSMEKEHCIFRRKDFENIAKETREKSKKEDFYDFVGLTPAEVVRRMYHYKRLYWLYRYDKEYKISRYDHSHKQWDFARRIRKIYDYYMVRFMSLYNIDPTAPYEQIPLEAKDLE